jgi:GNAT superfamily N-acetyltransferase
MIQNPVYIAPVTKRVLPSSNPQAKIIEVSDDHLGNVFMGLPEVIYQGDTNWIPPIRKEIVSIFDPALNPYFKHGDARRWIAVNHAGQALGRIAAFINFRKMIEGDIRVGCIGFFECVDDQQVAFSLFDTALEWLVDTHQIDAVDGPVNFGENDKFWGLLIKGFTPPSYGMTYNPPYYRSFFESYGFNIHYRQFTNHVNLQRPLPERFRKIAERVNKQDRYSFRPFRYRDRTRFIRDFVNIYNQAWASFNNFQPMDEAVVRKSLSEMKPVMVEDFIWFAYVDNRPAGLLVGVPDVNDVLRYSGSHFNWWGKCKFLFYKYTKGFTGVRVVIMGVIPEFQRHGLESGLVYHAFREGKKRPRYKHVQLAWVGDFNHKMIAIHKAMGAVGDKQHATYRKIL